MDCCILSSKRGPWGSLLSDSTPGISCGTVTSIPSCHTLCCLNTTVCLSVYLCVCDMGFHHVRYSKADLLCCLYAPYNVSNTLILFFFFHGFRVSKHNRIKIFCLIWSACVQTVGKLKVVLVVLLMFGQLRPCFPQGEQSLTGPSKHTVTLAHISYGKLYIWGMQ